MKSSHKLSLQAKMAILCSAIAAAAILLVSIFQVITVPRLLRDKASAITMGNLETVASGLNQHLNGMLSFASTFTSNTEISTALTRNNPRYTYRDSTLISTVFRLVLVSNENLIDSIVITTDKGKRYIGGNGGYLSPQVIEERFAALEKDLSISNWTIRYETAPVRNQTSMNHLQHFVSLYYILRDTVSLERIGVMYIAMNPEALLPSLDDSSRTLLLADSDGQIVIASENAEISPSLLEKLDQHTQDTSGSFLFDTSAGTTFAVFSGSAVSGWRLIETVPYDSLVGDARQFILLLSVLLLIAFASVILLTLYGTHKSLAPLKRLRDSMLAVQQGNYDVQ
ncbi:MAG: cache domain-containing protein, partial [Clostridia bacterium]|nr:cache domain-containing protein [Clostridia bacterium]